MQKTTKQLVQIKNANNHTIMGYKKKTLGIIGVGQFTKFFLPHLKPFFSEIFISSRSDKSSVAKELGVRFSSKIHAAKQDIVILSMPISEIENVLKEIKDSVKTGALVMDVCSVKAYPVRLMKKILPKNTNILGTHPLFGPQSGKRGLKGLEIVFCPTRISAADLRLIGDLFKAMGLKVILTTPEKHDKIIANTQALTHFFARGVINSIRSMKFEFSTPSARKLFEIINDVKEDSPLLFRDIESLNPYAKSMRKRLIDNLNKLNKNL